MKVEVLKETLSKALSHIMKAVGNRPNLPILNNVYIEATGNSLKLSSTDLEIGINVLLGAEVAEPGRVTVSAKLFFEFVNSLKPGKVRIIESGQKLEVENKDNKAEFFVIPADDFPTVPSPGDEPTLSIDAIDFSNALDKTTFSSSTDTSRPVLTGVLFRASKRKTTLVGVDGYRLSLKTLVIESKIEKDIQEIIPAKSLSEVSKIIKEECKEKEKVEIFLLKNNNQIIFKINGVEFATRLIEGEFPSFEDIIPKDNKYSFSVLKSELEEAVKIVNIFARNVVGNKTRFVVATEENKLKLSAVVVDIGKNETVVDITKVEGEDMETAYNARFLQEMIGAIESDEVVYETNGPTAPGVFKDKKDKDFLHIIMPMRLE